MGKTVAVGGLKIAKSLYNLVCNDILPNIALVSGITADGFWKDLEEIARDLSPKNKALLQKRDFLQKQIDAWHLENRVINLEKYKTFLYGIGYLIKEGDDFKIPTNNVDEEISLIAGPQLVVPVNNARFALNASNARWGSLYDALYGSDVIAEDKNNKTSGFNKSRALNVIEKATSFLDEAIPLNQGKSHRHVIAYNLDENNQLHIQLSNGRTGELAKPSQFFGYQQSNNQLVLLFKNNNLHLELQIDSKHPIGQLHPASIKNIVMESAITTIQDCEDSVTAVDAEDKVDVYRNWLGLMRGDLSETFEKKSKRITRKLNPDRIYQTSNGSELKLSGRSLLLIRNVGHLMTSDAVLYSDSNNEEIPEGILDAMITSLIALYDIHNISPYKNSKTNSIYIVKPKMHGPEEVAFTVALFSRVEEALNLPENTIKLGIMDEERRTTVNLKECIREAKDRVIFINTGFLDRTGDEIHTSMHAGAFLPKSDIKKQPWITAYEDWNVDIGLACGFKGKAQIGKGMWAMPDEMEQMMEQKIDHLKAGANCAWVPSPTAATLHAMHYHQILVSDQQDRLATRPRASLDDILTIPLLSNNVLDKKLTAKEIQQELDNNAQGILGYVVRWIDHGVGCSKVPDINNIGLMEDRATLRISSQHMANWLMHSLCTEQQIKESFKRMAIIVDEQNKSDPLYTNMSPKYESLAYQVALDLVLKGDQQPNGYTEPLLHKYRRKYKH